MDLVPDFLHEDLQLQLFILEQATVPLAPYFPRGKLNKTEGSFFPCLCGILVAATKPLCDAAVIRPVQWQERRHAGQ